MTIDELIEKLNEIKETHVMAGRAEIYENTESAKTILGFDFDNRYNMLHFKFGHK